MASHSSADNPFDLTFKTLYKLTLVYQGFLNGSVVKNLPTKLEVRVDPWVGKNPWSRKWEATPIFLPGKSHEQRILGATVHGVTKELDMT